MHMPGTTASASSRRMEAECRDHSTWIRKKMNKVSCPQPGKGTINLDRLQVVPRCKWKRTVTWEGHVVFLRINSGHRPTHGCNN